MTGRRIRLTNLILVEERLQEAAYFARALGRQHNAEAIKYHLNAFLSAACSVTFILQKVMSGVPEFGDWWREQQDELSRDKAARFFLKLRNYSQKEGRVSLVGVRVPKGGCSRWRYRFAGNPDKVPSELLHRDVVDCCIEHVAKLAKVTLKCCDRFPYHTSPRRALTREGVQALDLSLNDICEAAGLPREWAAGADGISEEEVLRLIRESVDDLDFALLCRLTKCRPRARVEDTADATLGQELLERMVVRIENLGRELNVPVFAGELLLAKMLRDGSK